MAPHSAPTAALPLQKIARVGTPDDRVVTLCQIRAHPLHDQPRAQEKRGVQLPGKWVVCLPAALLPLLMPAGWGRSLCCNHRCLCLQTSLGTRRGATCLNAAA